MKKILFSAIASLSMVMTAVPVSGQETSTLTVSERLCPPERSPCTIEYIVARLVIAPARGRDYVTEADLEDARNHIPANQRGKRYRVGDKIILRG